jgi:hypothetical protein
MSNKKKKKRKEKFFKPESIPNRSDKQNAAPVQGNGENDSTYKQPNIAIHTAEKKRNWDRYFNIGSTAANIFVAFFAFIALKHSRQAVKDNIENFRLQNMPYLQAGNFRYKNDTLSFSLFNLNHYPARIKEGKLLASGQSDINYLAGITSDSLPIVHIDGTFSIRPAISTVLNKYIIKDSPIDVVTPQADLIFFNNKDGYLLGQLSYTDEVAKTERFYEFIIRISGTRQNIKAEFFKNMNWNVAE